MLTFQEFYNSIKEMGSYIAENSGDSESYDKISAFIKHVNVNCQYNYNVISLINENSDTPSKQKPTISLSSSVWESLGDDSKRGKSANKEKEDKLEYSNSKERSKHSGMIDDNITKALNALRSPRLSIPHSNDQSSTPESIKIPKSDDDAALTNSEEK